MISFQSQLATNSLRMSCTQIQCYSVPEIPCSAYNLIRFQCRQIDAVSRVPNCGGPLKVYIRGSLHSLCDTHSNYPNGQTELLIVQRIIILRMTVWCQRKHAELHMWVFWGGFEAVLSMAMDQLMTRPKESSVFCCGRHLIHGHEPTFTFTAG